MKVFTDLSKKKEIKVDDTVTCHGEPSKVIRIHPFGTIDVEQLRTGDHYRITGLMWGK